MTRIERQIERTKEKLAKLRIQKQEEEARKKSAKRRPAKRGRKPLDSQLLQKIKLEAFTRPLPDVAFKNNVALSSLYKHGITRKALEAELDEKAKAIALPAS